MPMELYKCPKCRTKYKDNTDKNIQANNTKIILFVFRTLANKKIKYITHDI